MLDRGVHSQMYTISSTLAGQLCSFSDDCDEKVAQDAEQICPMPSTLLPAIAVLVNCPGIVSLGRRLSSDIHL